MKRTIPLLITAIGGFVLIVATFIPATESWGEVAAVWFDILASIAFVLGGGSLLKGHLKKVSDQAAGWGYSLVTLVAFLVTLSVGLAKVGVQPAPDQEYYGETFTTLALSDFPESQVTTVEGQIPQKAVDAKLPDSVHRQLRQEDDRLVFRGWMRPNQKSDLFEYHDTLEWQCKVEQLFDRSQPPEPLQQKVAYYVHHQALSFQGYMKDEHRSALLAMSDAPQWNQAVKQLDEQSRKSTTIPLEELPETVSIPESLSNVVSYDQSDQKLRIQGPMSPSQRAALTDQFPVAKPLNEEQRQNFLQEIESRGEPLTPEQKQELDRVLDGTWTVQQLVTALNEAGRPREVEKTACEMLEEKQAGVDPIQPTRTVGEDVSLNEEQLDAVEAFATDPGMPRNQLVELLRGRGTFTEQQQAALSTFLEMAPTVGERSRLIYFTLQPIQPLSAEQTDFLMDEFRQQLAWQAVVGDLYLAAHQPKYEWSGAYRSQGTPFWWLYEYAFKPLTATMFAMLAFYVASAAFRAFRAKNLEAMLLLGTAFIILLGRTFAGVLLTSWLPESLSGLRIENLTMTIMNVFNTAGNRAIMIGIALGIASTSLKVLLGVDRSYLGSQED